MFSGLFIFLGFKFQVSFTFMVAKMSIFFLIYREVFFKLLQKLTSTVKKVFLKKDFLISLKILSLP